MSIHLTILFYWNKVITTQTAHLHRTNTVIALRHTLLSALFHRPLIPTSGGDVTSLAPFNAFHLLDVLRDWYFMSLLCTYRERKPWKWLPKQLHMCEWLLWLPIAHAQDNADTCSPIWPTQNHKTQGSKSKPKHWEKTILVTEEPWCHPWIHIYYLARQKNKCQLKAPTQRKQGPHLESYRGTVRSIFWKQWTCVQNYIKPK